MLLRDHPLLSYKGNSSWPPTWTWIDGPENERPRGEVGLLLKVYASKIEPIDRCFLYISHQRSFYLGCLLIDDQAFCHQMMKLLQNHSGRAIGEIGGLDVTYTF
jgi:hypothetical protein